MKKNYFLLLILLISSVNLTAQSPHLFGVTTNGGTNDFGYGTIFRTDTNGTNYSLVDTFAVENDGARQEPQQLVEVNGKLYGTTINGGMYSHGVLFEFNPSTGAYAVKHNFIDSSGSYPRGYLMLASNGKIYGTTFNGGANSNGALFEFNVTTGVYAKLADFNNVLTGRYPSGQMVEASTGIIYGVCSSGGSANYGTVYQYTISTNTLVKKDDFVASVNGRSPLGGLMKANNGKLYGMAQFGGSINEGTLFEYNLVADSIKKLYDFDKVNGKNPITNLMQASNGKLYGTTQYGGSASGTGRGVLFDYDITTNTLTKLQTFDSWIMGAGYYASGGLVESTSGKFLICMRSGGPNFYAGAIAEYTLATNTLVGKSYFDRYLNGAAPQGKVVKATSGKYYGVTNNGGSGDVGVIFEYDNTLDTILNVKSFSAAYDGKTPTNDLIHASNGKLYGITSAGGNGNGVIFEVDPNTHNVVKKAQFDGANGGYPKGALVEVNGKIYGTTLSGGINNRGVLYSYDLSSSVITGLIDFNLTSVEYPANGLIKATNGKLYGTTLNGGIYGRGGLFEYDITLDTLIVKGNFGGPVNRGYTAEGKLMQATNGKLYGTTTYGGNYNNNGTIYEFDFVTDSIKFSASFNDTNGSRPSGGMIQTSTGKLYGMTIAGNSAPTAANSHGVVYEFDINTNTIISKANFGRFTLGLGGLGELLESSNGKLYGLSFENVRILRTARGSRIVEFDPVTNSLLSIHRLTGVANGSLIEVVSSNTASIEEEEFTQELLVYPNPTNSILNIDTKGERIETIRVYTTTGQLVNSQLNNNTIDVSNYKSGLYIIQVETQNGIALSRFIKN